MKMVNLLLVVLLAVLTMSCGGLIFLVTAGGLQPAAFGNASWLTDRLAPFGQLTGATEARTLAVCGALVLLGLLLLVAELVAAVPRRRRAPLSPDGLGPLGMDDDLIRELAAREAAQVAGVQGLRLRVKQGDAGLRLDGKLAVEPLANVAEVARDLRLRIKATLERALGQRVDEFHLRCTPVSGRSKGRPEPARFAAASPDGPAPAREPAAAGQERVATPNGAGAR